MAIGYARYPQNQGLYQSVEQLRQLNQAAASRPVQPYRPVGMGASYGNPIPMQPAPRAMGLMPAPTNQQGYNEQMASQNPGGRFYGGLLPTMISGQGGMRPGFMAPPAAPAPGFDNNQRYAAQNGLYMTPSGAMSGNPDAGQWSNRTVQLAQITGRGPTQQGLTPQAAAAGRPAYEQAYAQRQAAQRGQVMNRVAIRDQNQQERYNNALAAQQQQMFGLLAQRNPALAVELAQLQQRGQLAQGQLAYQNAALQQQGLLGTQQSADRRYVADAGLAASQNNAWSQRYSEAIKAGQSPADAAQIAGPPPMQGGGLMGSPVAQAPQPTTTGKPRKQLLDSQLAQISALPPDQREAALRGMGVSDPADIHYYQTQLNPQYSYQQAARSARQATRQAIAPVTGYGQALMGSWLSGLLGP